MKNIAIASLLALATLSACEKESFDLTSSISQDMISGTVQDVHDNPIAGVSVAAFKCSGTIQGGIWSYGYTSCNGSEMLYEVVLTDAAGNYQFHKDFNYMHHTIQKSGYVVLGSDVMTKLARIRLHLTSNFYGYMAGDTCSLRFSVHDSAYAATHKGIYGEELAGLFDGGVVGQGTFVKEGSCSAGAVNRIRFSYPSHTFLGGIADTSIYVYCSSSAITDVIFASPH